MYLEIVLLFITLYYTYVFFAKPTEMPPGTFGYPIIGNLPPSNKTITEHFSEMKKKYGNIFTTKWGSFPTVVLTDYDLIKKVFANPDVQGRMQFYSVKAMNMFKRGGIILEEGHVWSENRRFMLKNLRDLGMGKSHLENSIQDEAKLLVKYLEDMDLEQPVEIDWCINVGVLNVIWQMLASKRYDHSDDVIVKFTEDANDDLQILQGPLFIYDIMPWMYRITPSFLFDKITRNREYLQHRENFYKLATTMIEDHEKTLDEDNPRDLIDSYLLEMKENDGKEGNIRSRDDLLITMNDMFFAGSETTAASIRWLILYMALNPEIQRKIHKLLDDNVSKESIPSLDERPNLQYLDAVILETLRLSSLIKIGLVHRTTTKVVMEQYEVPEDTLVFPALELVHRDPELWTKPYEFYPEHFLTEDGTLDSKKKGFVPFSLGRRQCLGESLARMELYLFAGAILHRFTITPPEGVHMDTSVDKTKILFNHAKPFKVMLKRRN